ncbi:hypothetical protein EDF46_0560 [Frondihabitans sp. PhB188]|uniref:type IV toxin-antitoxin system AbiEi family antitoxin domain-containing protein n=1 Tax=Frondihabitans sp. PhB188 TaxID=2485200 RepID=UPI000F4A6AF2|nr:type IV toxin-antitoxin system AbiEi family antitoxin domain-containing protein [Frondihabitans sp. PhB188]ROQ41184.1 hypothetical protein EDF46_0560 [Frondihabitans sp. PhB188]
MEAAPAVRTLGGLATRQQLVASGLTGADLTRAVRSGQVRRVIRGWYSTLPPHDPRVIAVSLGGSLTGVSALQLYGSWLWNRACVIDVVLTAGSPVPPSIPRNVRIFHGRAPRGSPVVPLAEALGHAVRRLPFEEAVAVLDWAHHTDQLDVVDLHVFAAGLPTPLRDIAAWVDISCESVLESIVRTRVRSAGHHVTSQVPLGLGAIDLVIDGVVALELDGRTFHADTFETDRLKDLAILTDGRIAMRASYAMVRADWPRVLGAIETALTTHWAPRRSRPRPRR